MAAKQKYCETLKVGYYLLNGDRCYYFTGSTKGIEQLIEN